ncbi:CHASE4 domain-containing protein [Pseudomonas aeruginosa]
MEDEAIRLHQRLDSELKNHLGLVQAFAWWDDTYEYMHNRNEEFERRSLNMDVLDDLGFDFIFLLDDDGQLIFKLWGAAEPDLPPDFSTTPNLVESVFRAGDGSEKAFYRRADSRRPQAGGGRWADEGTVSPTRLQ